MGATCSFSCRARVRLCFYGAVWLIGWRRRRRQRAGLHHACCASQATSRTSRDEQPCIRSAPRVPKKMIVRRKPGTRPTNQRLPTVGCECDHLTKDCRITGPKSPCSFQRTVGLGMSGVYSSQGERILPGGSFSSCLGAGWGKEAGSVGSREKHGCDVCWLHTRCHDGSTRYGMSTVDTYITCDLWRESAHADARKR